MAEKHTNLEWELNLEGIIGEIEANGSLNGIDVNDKKVVKRIAESVIKDSYYTKKISNLEFSDNGDKLTRYYDILWETIDSYK